MVRFNVAPASHWLSGGHLAHSPVSEYLKLYHCLPLHPAAMGLAVIASLLWFMKSIALSPRHRGELLRQFRSANAFI